MKLIRNDLSTRPDEIPIRYINMGGGEIICSPITHIVNAFIKDNTSQWTNQQSTNHPINKVPSPNESSHYRIIAILSPLSKAFERIFCNQVIDFIERLNIYKDTLTGFRRGFSTGVTLLKLRDDVRRAMNAGEISIIALIDLSKAFDTISRDTLIKSLHKMGFFLRDFVRWSVSYLSNRKKCVQIDAQQSKPMTTYFWVPQGSILGTLLFNLNGNGLQDSAPSQSIQYADDTTIYELGRPNDIKMTTYKINSSLEKKGTMVKRKLSGHQRNENQIFNQRIQKIVWQSSNQRKARITDIAKENLSNWMINLVFLEFISINT